eukprot:CAMPEP_0119334316 /NCGR_PEP_ID=MMETSP1333-20130426/87025_1 /TAXON_ID=418940 /ORGANISM="Scyphosphaera apsteinii, Strain RCC1455" /LENGTH=154 /DNA_ID=CAMNT_0007344581 /DNA_START=23 /DNA_END=487 /DNA_ORIENTATION=-
MGFGPEVKEQWRQQMVGEFCRYEAKQRTYHPSSLATVRKQAKEDMIALEAKRGVAAVGAPPSFLEPTSWGKLGDAEPRAWAGAPTLGVIPRSDAPSTSHWMTEAQRMTSSAQQWGTCDLGQTATYVANPIFLASKSSCDFLNEKPPPGHLLAYM